MNRHQPVKGRCDGQSPRGSAGGVQQERPAGAFTLIELLVVIAVIGILAGLFIGLYPGVREKMVRARVEAEKNGLVLAIENYKKDLGFYPPDNPANAAQSPLFYELVGTAFDGTQYAPLIGATPVRAADLQNKQRLGVDGFVNSTAGSKTAKNYLPGLLEKQHAAASVSGVLVEMLLVPFKGPGGDFNPWRYTSGNPTNNAGEFDLWADLRFGNKTITIGNWKQ